MLSQSRVSDEYDAVIMAQNQRCSLYSPNGRSYFFMRIDKIYINLNNTTEGLGFIGRRRESEPRRLH